MKSVLVTGGCGFIGRRLIACLLARGVQSIRVVDNLSVGTVEALAKVGDMEVVAVGSDAISSKRIHLFEGDIEDANLANHVSRGVDVVVHLAANTGVGPSVAQPQFDFQSNVVGTFNYIEAARRNGVKRFVFASSGAVTGECEPPIHESVLAIPVSPYGASKLAGEAYCNAYAKTFRLGTMALRFSNVYGPGCGHKQSVVAKFIRQALSGETAIIYGDGSQTRDFIFVDDLVEAILCAIEKAELLGETFQIATMKETSIIELLKVLNHTLDIHRRPPLKVKFSDRRHGDVHRNFADTSKAKKYLGWEAKTALRSGINDTVEWALNALEGVSPTRPDFERREN